MITEKEAAVMFDLFEEKDEITKEFGLAAKPLFMFSAMYSPLTLSGEKLLEKARKFISCNTEE